MDLLAFVALLRRPNNITQNYSRAILRFPSKPSSAITSQLLENVSVLCKFWTFVKRNKTKLKFCQHITKCIHKSICFLCVLSNIFPQVIVLYLGRHYLEDFTSSTSILVCLLAAWETSMRFSLGTRKISAGALKMCISTTSRWWQEQRKKKPMAERPRFTMFSGSARQSLIRRLQNQSEWGGFAPVKHFLTSAILHLQNCSSSVV